MERNAKYLVVGAFVVAFVAIGVGFLLWYSKAGDARNYARYEIDFTGSVSGLDQGSVVRYLGVDVGRVRRMSLDRNHPSQVKVLVDIDDIAPISGATRANLNMQGVTGLLFINLKQIPDGDPNAPLKQGERYPMIQSVSSDFDVLLETLPELVGRASSVIENIDAVFSKQNLDAVSQTLENIRATTKSLPKTAESVAQVVEQLKGTMGEIDSAVVTFRGIADESRPEIKLALQRLSTAADNLSVATDRVNKFVAGAEVQVGHLSEHGLFELERLLRDTRTAANEFRDLSRSLKQQPSQLLYEKPVTGTEIRR